MKLKNVRELQNGPGDDTVNLGGKITILEIDPLCKTAVILIANDTGRRMSPRARIVRPMIVIYEPTDPQRVKPMGDPDESPQADIWRKTVTKGPVSIICVQDGSARTGIENRA